MTTVTADPELVNACGDDPGIFCEWIFNRTSNDTLSGFAGWLIDRPLKIAIILVVAWVVNRILRRAVTRFGERAAARGERDRIQQERKRQRGIPAEVVTSRAEQRAKTITTVMASGVSAIVWVAAAMFVLDQLNVSLAPLLAGAGVLGLMLGFGAQSIVADFLAGIFMLIEDQFGVGDVVDVGEVTGTVETVSLRVTTLRDVQGTVWHVPNSEIRRIGNLSQIWSRAVLDIEVAYDTDLRRAEGVIQRVADELWRDETFTAGDIIDPPEVWGVQELGASGIAIRLVVKTDPADQWVIGRELRLRIKEAFDEADIEIPFPQQTVWLRRDEVPTTGRPPAVDVAPIRQNEDEIIEQGG